MNTHLSFLSIKQKILLFIVAAILLWSAGVALFAPETFTVFQRFLRIFFKVNNLMNIVLQVSVIAIIAFGMTYVLLIGEIDLSVGSIVALVGSLSALLLSRGWPAEITIPLVLFAGLLLGACNGLLTTGLAVPSFIVTVATMGVFRGSAYITSNGLPISIDHDALLYLGNGSILHIPVPVWILIILLCLNHFVLSRTVFGRRSYLLGGNAEAALYAGIRVHRQKIMIFMISGLMSAVAGLIMTARLYSAQPNAAIGYELDAIASAVLGGTSLSGGYGTMIGTMIGALIIGVINNCMNLLSVPYFYQLIVKGLVILIAVAIDAQSKKQR